LKKERIRRREKIIKKRKVKKKEGSVLKDKRKDGE
jgi:hypothetical protein